jgi:hypothetical protein
VQSPDDVADAKEKEERRREQQPRHRSEKRADHRSVRQIADASEIPGKPDIPADQEREGNDTEDFVQLASHGRFLCFKSAATVAGFS